MIGRRTKREMAQVFIGDGSSTPLPIIPLLWGHEALLEMFGWRSCFGVFQIACTGGKLH